MSTARILVVDDDQASCYTTKRLLTELGYEVDAAYDGAGALALVGVYEYDLLVLDYRMPDMDGLELFARIKEERADIAGVFLTAYASIDMIEAALEAGAKRVIPKDADANELGEVVHQIFSALRRAQSQPNLPLQNRPLLCLLF